MCLERVIYKLMKGLKDKKNRKVEFCLKKQSTGKVGQRNDKK